MLSDWNFSFGVESHCRSINSSCRVYLLFDAVSKQVISSGRLRQNVAAGHIIMYDRKQSAGQSKSRHGPGPARGPYVARPCSNTTLWCILNGLHEASYNSVESEPIWMKFGKLSAKCWGLAMADFGCDPRSSHSLRGSRKMFVFPSDNFHEFCTQQRRSVSRCKLCFGFVTLPDRHRPIHRRLHETYLTHYLLGEKLCFAEDWDNFHEFCTQQHRSVS